MLNDVQLSISCSLKSHKIKGIQVRIEILTRVSKNDFYGLNNDFIDIEIAKLKVPILQNVSFSQNG